MFLVLAFLRLTVLVFLFSLLVTIVWLYLELLRLLAKLQGAFASQARLWR